MKSSIESLIEKYQLTPHPEGGFFKETYRANEFISMAGLPSRFSGKRCFSTAIYFLLPNGTKSLLHRIKADEIWHFYSGGPLNIVEITPGGHVRHTSLGQDAALGHLFQHVVPAGHWFGAYPAEEAQYSFVGCTVSPGFDFADFEIANRETLLSQFPGARTTIEKLTTEDSTLS